MTDAEWSRLPALTGCPGKPACDRDCLCGDHRDVYRAMQRIDAEWRDTVVQAREARDRAELQVDEARRLLQRFLNAGPEEEYQVILCKLSEDVEVFLSSKAEKPKNATCDIQVYGGTQTCGLPLPCDIHDRHIPEKRVQAPRKITHCLKGADGCESGSNSCSCPCADCVAITNF